jgi:hypothetical protein
MPCGEFPAIAQAIVHRVNQKLTLYPRGGILCYSDGKQRRRAMVGQLTRGAYLLILLMMIAVYAAQAVQAAKSAAPEPPQDQQPAERMYS